MKASQAKKKTGTKKGDKYECGVCGLVVTIDKKCGCTGTCEIMCCEKPMKKVRKTK
ncbi:hypothetical protein IBX73_05420 [candidate division WOR-3 bacterium]|nr:hypothetical protein [candidate division WOR-3 bacterium]